MRRISRLAAPALVALAAAAPAIAATYESGRYAGTTSQINKQTGKHRKITFNADAVNGEVTKIKFYAKGKCSDDGTSGRLHGTPPERLFADVDDTGHFSMVAKSPSGATTIRVSGDLAGNKASGTLSVKSRFNAKTNEPDPNGSVRCSTGKVRWSAKRTT